MCTIWKELKASDEDVLNLSEKLNIHTLLAKILADRNIDVDTARKMLKDYHECILDPRLLVNAEEASIMIADYCKDENARIEIFADYDADGITSGYILTSVLRLVAKCKVNVYYPERREGYGLNNNFVSKLIEDSANSSERVLVITVDNGIGKREEVAMLKANGIEVIVTDHHTPNGNVPDCLVIDPYYNDNGHYKYLAGCGVAFKVAQLVLWQFDRGAEMMDYTYAVAIGTLGDVMPMSLENIALVSYGLMQINGENCPKGIKAYKDYTGKKKITATDVVWEIVPRINACGRMDNINLAGKLFFTDNLYENTDKEIIDTIIEEMKLEIKTRIIDELIQDIQNEIDYEQLREYAVSKLEKSKGREITEKLIVKLMDTEEKKYIDSVLNDSMDAILKNVEDEFDSISASALKKDIEERIMDKTINNIEITNKARKELTDKAINELKDIDFSTDLVCIIDGTKYPEGISGVIAGKAVEIFSKPAIVYAGHKEIKTASARCPQEYNLQTLLTSQKELGIIEGFGGHAKAAGLQVKEESIEELKESLNNSIAEVIKDIEIVEEKEEVIYIDSEISLKQVNENMYNIIHSIPYDKNTFSTPVFILKGVELKKAPTPSSKNPNNIKLSLADNSGKLDAWAWGMADKYKEIGSPKNLDIVCTIENDFMNKKNYTIKIIDFREAS